MNIKQFLQNPIQIYILVELIQCTYIFGIQNSSKAKMVAESQKKMCVCQSWPVLPVTKHNTFTAILTSVSM